MLRIWNGRIHGDLRHIKSKVGTSKTFVLYFTFLDATFVGCHVGLNIIVRGSFLLKCFNLFVFYMKSFLFIMMICAYS